MLTLFGQPTHILGNLQTNVPSSHNQKKLLEYSEMLYLLIKIDHHYLKTHTKYYTKSDNNSAYYVYHDKYESHTLSKISPTLNRQAASKHDFTRLILSPKWTINNTVLMAQTLTTTTISLNTCSLNVPHMNNDLKKTDRAAIKLFDAKWNAKDNPQINHTLYHALNDKTYEYVYPTQEI